LRYRKFLLTTRTSPFKAKSRLLRLPLSKDLLCIEGDRFHHGKAGPSANIRIAHWS
jgi:hypothetical protein